MVGVTEPCSDFVREMNLDWMLAAMKNGVEEDIEVRTQLVFDFDHVNSGILKYFYLPPSMVIRFAVKQTVPCSGCAMESG